VIVPGLERKPPQNREKLLNWSEIDSDDIDVAQIVLAPIAERGEASKALNSWLRSVVRAREKAEWTRLFYVACTRAREELHLFASPKTNSRGEIAKEYGSLLATTWPVAERHFVAGSEAPVEGAKVVVMPPAAAADDLADDFVGDIAATIEQNKSKPVILKRLPLGFRPEARFSTLRRLSYGDAVRDPARFERPEGSFEARAFGNAAHAFVEILTKRFTSGSSAEALLREVAGWTPRIAAVLRGAGLAPSVVNRLAARVMSALNNVLKDAEGLWILGPHDGATSEFALTSWDDQRSSVRLDRMFLAGAKPLEPGSDYLWIIDYKTSTHGREGLDEFLSEERLKYESQMEAYARMMRDRVQPGRLRVGLYYPMLARLVWWEPEMSTSDAAD
jgi:ATP-dependent helicase/nuclease subunit A